MREKDLARIADALISGEIDRSDFVRMIKSEPFRDLGEVKLDLHRTVRKGFPEIIYCPGKSDSQLLSIAEALKGNSMSLLLSRITERQYNLVKEILPDLEFHETARMAGIQATDTEKDPGLVVVTGGSTDVPVAEEAAVTAEYMGCEVKRIYDVGVAGVHRLLSHVEEIQAARVIVAVAGMEGALPGVVAGLVSCPVIGVPTDIGYGANLGGIAPLLTMVNSCAPGVSVVNINNGLGAGYSAALIIRQCFHETS